MDQDSCAADANEIGEENARDNQNNDKKTDNTTVLQYKGYYIDVFSLACNL